jgi:peptidoglycan/xylan/chitin deacetylase (PgdA/CDA1 family)
MTDVDKLDLFLQENIGLRSRVFRFPGGSLAAGEIREECISALHESGYKYVDWNALTRDAEVKGLTLEGAYENLMPLATSKSMAVILMHDFNSASLGALPTIIEDLQAQNYVLLPLFDNSLVLK